MQNNPQSPSLLVNSNENSEDGVDLNSSTNSSNNSSSSNNNNINNSNNSSSNSSNVVKTSTSVNNKPTTLSQSSILLASNSIYKYINKNGKLPSYVTISGYKYSMSEFMYILSKTITYKYNKITSSIKVKYNVKNPSKASGNNIKGTISSKTYYSYAKNIVAFIEKNNQAPNFVTSSLGKIQYQTAIFGLNKVLNYIYVKGKLPSSLSFNVKASHSMNKYLPVYNGGSSSSSSSNSGSSGSSSIVAGKSTKLSQTAIFQASKNVKNYVLNYGKLPNYVTISGFKFSIPEYTYLVSKAIAYKCLKYTNSVNVKWDVKNPSNPSGVTIKKTISKSTYYSLAKKTFQYIDSNSRIPNYISSSFGKIQYQTFVYGFARIGEYIYTYKNVPSTLTLSVSKTNALNKKIGRAHV